MKDVSERMLRGLLFAIVQRCSYEDAYDLMKCIEVGVAYGAGPMTIREWMNR